MENKKPKTNKKSLNDQTGIEVPSYIWYCILEAYTSVGGCKKMMMMMVVEYVCFWFRIFVLGFCVGFKE